MKASHFIVPAVFTLASSFALADDQKKFAEVDQNKDGLLSVSEAREALPQLDLTAPGGTATGTDDAMLTRDAVKRALPEISFESGDERGPITEDEYDTIIEELEERGMTASTGSATGAAAASSTRSSTATESHDRSGAASSQSGRTAPGASASGTVSGGASSSQSASSSAEADRDDADSPAADTRVNRNTNSTAQPGASNAGPDTNDAADREID